MTDERFTRVDKAVRFLDNTAKELRNAAGSVKRGLTPSGFKAHMEFQADLMEACAKMLKGEPLP